MKEDCIEATGRPSTYVIKKRVGVWGRGVMLTFWHFSRSACGLCEVLTA